MTFAAPWGFAAVLLAGPLVVWYVLRSRRPRVVVASTLLWRHSDEAVTAAVPWTRFRPDVTFWLVLLAILTLAVTLARPAFPTPVVLGDHTILLVDASASMLADEGGPTRLELARREAEDLVAALGPGQRISVVEASTRARVLLSASGDPAAVRAALRSVVPGQGAADLTDAFTLAAALQRPAQSTVVQLLTDGVVPPEHAAAAPAGLRITAVGQPRPNLAVTRLQAVPTGAGAAQVFAQVRNFGPLGTTARLRLAAGATELDVRDLELTPRGVADVVTDVALPQGDSAVLRATVEASGADALAVDDTAFAVVTGAQDLVALVAGPGSVYLESALAAVGGIEVRRADRVPEDLSGVDLLVADRVAVPARPAVPTLAVAPPAGPQEVRVGEPVAQPTVTFQDPAHELLADVDLSGLAVAEARPVAGPTVAPLASGPDGALLAAGTAGGRPYLHVAFDLAASNLPLQVAWPVLIANAVAWLAGPPTPPALVAGAEVDLPLPVEATGAEVAPPAGEPVRLDPGRPTLRLDQVGVWTPRWLGPEELEPPAPIAVNAVPEEGDLARDRPPLPTTAPPATDPAAPDPTPAARPLGPGLLAAALALVLAEWLWSQYVSPRRARRPRRAAPIAPTTARRWAPWA